MHHEIYHPSDRAHIDRINREIARLKKDVYRQYFRLLYYR